MDRAICLLGAFAQPGIKLREKNRRELESLLGCLPDHILAAHWKKNLKEIRRELAAEPPEEDD